MNSIDLPTLTVTGASGFIGHYFVTSVADEYRLFCLARRSQKEVGIPRHKNIIWIQADITDWKELRQVGDYILRWGGSDYVLHLAGYYDFSLKDHPAYERVNVTGTRNVLHLAEYLGSKRFLFSSSLAGCAFSSERDVTEITPLDAEFPYARSKASAESIIREHSSRVPCSVIRLAAVYSDWCEYLPLYFFLETWLGKGLQSKFMGGRGRFSLPYIHIKDIVDIFLRVIEKSDNLPSMGIYLASHQGSVTLEDIYHRATKYYFNRQKEPWHLPWWAAAAGIFLMSGLQKAFHGESLLHPWMVRYIDSVLNVDPAATYAELNWRPTPRYSILRRLLFLVENKIMSPNNWHFRNRDPQRQHRADRVRTLVYHAMMEIRENVVESILAELMDTNRSSIFPHYQRMDEDVCRWYLNLLFQLIALSIRNRDRSILTEYDKIICTYRYIEGFEEEELTSFLLLFESVLRDRLLRLPQLARVLETTNNYLTFTIQFVLDEREDLFEMLQESPPTHYPKIQDTYSISNSEDLKWLVRRLQNICGDPLVYG